MLIKAVKEGNFEEFDLIVKTHSFIDMNYRCLQTGQTALMHAQDANFVNLIVKKGAGKI
jgi:hypothetical protein